MPTDASLRALRILRDGGQFQWYVIPLLALVLYVYATEVERRNWKVVYAGMAFWGMDWFNEICNGLVFHFTQYAPVWGTPGGTAYLILIGLNIEICFMFAIAGIAVAKTLPADRHMPVIGLPNRWVIAACGALFCVVVELFLNAAGALTWDYRWWNAGAPWLIFLLGYLPFFLVSFWVHDMPDRRRQRRTVSAILGVDIIGLALFGGLLEWV